VIAKAEGCDLQKLLEIEKSCFGDRRFDQEYVEWILRNASCVTLVERTENAVAGSLMLFLRPPKAKILSIGVLPRHRRKGIATALMESAEALARGRGVTYIDLEVGVENEGPSAFYRKLGYQIVERLEGYYSWGEDAFLMAKGL